VSVNEKIFLKQYIYEKDQNVFIVVVVVVCVSFLCDNVTSPFFVARQQQQLASATVDAIS